MGNSNTTDDVFGVSRDLPLNYVARENIDEKFVNRLSQRHNIVIFGSSKQGKTSLRKKCLFDNDCIVVSSANTWSLAELHNAILKKAGFRTELSTKKTISGQAKLDISVSGSIRVPLLAKGEATTKLSGEGGAGKEVETKSIEIDPSDANDLILALNSIEFSRYIVIEDFHYLPEETQRNFSFALKTFHENSKYCFVVVGVWREENRLIGFNGDLTERVHSIDVDTWSDADLRKVIEEGENLLNIEFDANFKDVLLKNSFKSVHLVQEACRRGAKMAGVNETLAVRTIVGQDCNPVVIVSDIVRDQSGRYMGFLQNVSEGFQETKKEMPKWVIYAILTSTEDEREKGIRLGTISRRIRAKHPDGNDLNPGNLTQILQTFSSLQSKKNVRPIIVDYDTQNRALYVVDKGFNIWFSNQNRDEILEELGLPTD